MKPAFKTRSNAFYHVLGAMARAGKPEPTLAQFNALYSIHQNRRGYVLHKVNQLSRGIL
jgi:hypothetical protein